MNSISKSKSEKKASSSESKVGGTKAISHFLKFVKEKKPSPSSQQETAMLQSIGKN